MVFLQPTNCFVWPGNFSADVGKTKARRQLEPCLLYTSDAADERSSVDLGGRRIIKKKKKTKKKGQCRQKNKQEIN